MTKSLIRLRVPAAPTTLPTPTRETEERGEVLALRPYVVILHNDDHNEMGYVVQSLRRSVPELSVERAVEIMLEAHKAGHAVVITCPLELAELYRDRLESCGLTATIEQG